MTRRPTRATTDGRAYLDLQNLARQQRRPTDELLQIFALEGFLARLATSPYADRLVLKGGVLLAAFDARRPTRDIDLQGQRISNDSDDLSDMVAAIAAIDLEDGLEFDTAGATAETIRDEEAYNGVRITFVAHLSVAKLHLHIDINVGDPVWPEPEDITLPRLLEGSIELRGYPLSMVFAEKLVTAVQRGLTNTRWRDYADVYLLSRRHEVVGAELTEAAARVAAHRQTELAPLASVLEGYDAIGQTKWRAWRRKQHLEDRLPEQFGDVLQAVIEFADPALQAAVDGQYWSAVDRAWKFGRAIPVRSSLHWSERVSDCTPDLFLKLNG